LSFEIQSDAVDVEEIMRQIRKRIEEKKQGLYTDEEIEDIARHRLDAVLDAHEFNADFVSEFRDRERGWNYSFGPGTLYRSSRGFVGQALEKIRGVLKPVQKLFWNPNPMISALSRQSDLNAYYVHVLHNLTLEITRLNLELQDLKNRHLQLQGRLELQERREKTLESMVVFRDEKQREPGGGSGGDPGGGASA
jgi:hypothetical protein